MLVPALAHPPPTPALPWHPSPAQFGESQQLRMVRILRSTLMVRVGGGWIALDEFLVKNDPCRGGCGCPAPGTGAGSSTAKGVGSGLSPGLGVAGVPVSRGGGAGGRRGPSGLTLRDVGPRDPRCQPRSPPAASPVKGRTNLKINEKYLSPDAFGAAAAKCAGNQSAPSSKVLSPSRSNSSLSLYSSASAPSSPLARKVRCWGAPQDS